MAATVGAGGLRGRVNAQVNVTPFVDVMLVLLIIFMVAAPLATVAVPVNLSLNVDGPPPPIEPVFVSLQDNGTINVGTRSSGEVAATWGTLRAVLRQKSGGDLGRQLMVRADQKVAYADVMRLMDELQNDGYRNRTLVTEDVVD